MLHINKKYYQQAQGKRPSVARTYLFLNLEDVVDEEIAPLAHREVHRLLQNLFFDDERVQNVPLTQRKRLFLRKPLLVLGKRKATGWFGPHHRSTSWLPASPSLPTSWSVVRYCCSKLEQVWTTARVKTYSLRKLTLLPSRMSVYFSNSSPFRS